MTLALRPYQRESCDALYNYWENGGGNALIVLPTGAGKSLVIATIVRELMTANPAMRIGIVTHTKELIAQNFKELLKFWPQAPAGIYSAGIGRRDTHSRVLFCGIQSVWNKIDRIGKFDLIIVDEAHLISRSADTTYGKFLSDMRAANADLRVAGLTATPYRLDSGRLDRGSDKLFDQVVYDANVRDLIVQGYLSPLVSRPAEKEFDLSGVRKRGGDYIPGEQEVAINKDWIIREAVSDLIAKGADRRAWLVFTAGVDHAKNVRDEIRSRGITCEMVTGETPNGERDRIIRDYAQGNIRSLVNVNVLAIGFNVPHVDLIALMRKTLSPGLYIQQVGRAFRNAPAKKDALILDFAGNVRTHGPVDMVNVSGSSGAKGDGAVKEDDVRAKECPGCKSLVALNTRTCPVCSHEWPMVDKPKHEAVADSTLPILSTEAPAWLHVDGVRYFKHNKPEAPPSMRVEYACGIATHRCWICFEHAGYARQKAEAWWRQNATGPVPATIDEAITRQAEINCPGEIRVKANGRYFEIVGYRTLRRDAA